MIFLQAARTGRLFAYDVLFEAAWHNALNLVLTGLFVGVFWLLLALWGALFDVLGISFFEDLFYDRRFVYAATGLVGGLGLVIIRSYGRTFGFINTAGRRTASGLHYLSEGSGPTRWPTRQPPFAAGRTGSGRRTSLSESPGSRSCLQPATSCVVLAADAHDRPEAEYVLFQQREGSTVMPPEIYAAPVDTSQAAWQQIGTFDAVRGERAIPLMEALRAGRYAVQPSPWRELRIGDVRLQAR